MSGQMRAGATPLPGDNAHVELKSPGRTRYDRLPALEAGQVPGGGFDAMPRNMD